MLASLSGSDSHGLERQAHLKNLQGAVASFLTVSESGASNTVRVSSGTHAGHEIMTNTV